MKYLAILLAVGMLAGCTSAPVFLKHPVTGETAQCGPYKNTGMAANAGALREAQCVSDYRAQGYQRVKN